MTTALITGGTSGIGAAYARALAERGHHLVLVARDAERLAETAADLQQRHGITVEVIVADLGVRADVTRVADRLSSPDQPVEMLVNNAGFGIKAKLLSEDTSLHEQGIDVMIRAVLILSGAAGRAMRDRGRGTIINVSSTASWVPMGSYSAAKTWVTAYTEALANELRGTGVHVNAVCPGWVRTEFHQRLGSSMDWLPKPMWLDADQVVAESLADAERGRVISIPSKRYQVLMGVVRNLPRPAIRRLSRKLTSTRN